MAAAERIINAPIAAAIAYDELNGTVVVVDCCTTDSESGGISNRVTLSLIDIDDGIRTRARTRAHEGTHAHTAAQESMNSSAHALLVSGNWLFRWSCC